MWVVVTNPGIEVLHVNSNGFAQSWNFGLKSMDSRLQERLQHGLVTGLLFAAQPASSRQGVLDIKSIGT